MYMDINQQTIQSIRNWVKLDNEMRSLRNEMNTRKKQKDAISKELVNFMKHQDIDSFDINNGKIEHVTRKTKKPISKKLLLDILAKYYKPSIPQNPTSRTNKYPYRVLPVELLAGVEETFVRHVAINCRRASFCFCIFQKSSLSVSPKHMPLRTNRRRQL